MIGTAAKKSKSSTLAEILPILGMAVNAPVHLEKEVLSFHSKKYIKAPLCGSWCMSPILLTDDIKKCTCKQCIGMVVNTTYTNKTTLNLEGENEE